MARYLPLATELAVSFSLGTLKMPTELDLRQISKLNLHRYQGGVYSTEHVRHLETIKVSEKWVTHLAWSPWMVTQIGTCSHEDSHLTPILH